MGILHRKSRQILLIFLTISFGQCFIDHPDQDRPRCVWYGECGSGWNEGKLNCPANVTTRDAPTMTDKEGLRILKEYCPSLYNGTNTRTCCDVAQLQSFEQGMALPIQLLQKCPSCLYNFFDQICQMTCSPVQSDFLMANLTAPKPPGYTTGIPQVTYVVTEKYASSLYNSCKDVEMPSAHDKAISLFCGRNVDICTPHLWLEYMSSIGNGRAPFPVEYVFSDGPWKAPDGQVYQPLDVKNYKCSERPHTDSSVIGNKPCSCQDCAEVGPCPTPAPPPRPNNVTRQKYFDAEFGRQKYEAVEIKITRKDSVDPVQHLLPAPSTTVVNYTSIYDKEFLHQVLALQNSLAGLTEDPQGRKVSLDEVCIKMYGQPECVIESVLQYFQNNASNIDKVVYDDFHFFVKADYLDHYASCASSPLQKIDTTADHLSCRAAFGGITQPFIVLEGYKGDHDYANATTFVITFLLNRKFPSYKRDAWKNAVTSYLDNYNNPNMSVTYTTESLSDRNAPVFQVVPDSSYSIHASDTPSISNEPTQDNNNVDVQNLLFTPLNTNDKESTGIAPPNNDAADADVDLADESDDGEGHCVWYGQCGTGWNQGALNCPTTNETRIPPKLTDKDGLRILKKYCTDLYHGDDNTYTCCDTAQLHAIEGNLALPDQLLSRCPACYRNFLNQICYMTCSPVQSKFLIRNLKDTCPDGSQAVGGLCGKGIVSVTYIMTDNYTESLYKSCKDVQMPSANEKALSLFCGRPADECNSTIWLSYMGNTGNGRAPFPIYYKYTNVPYITPQNQSIEPLNINNTRCNETFSNSSAPCSCQDCEDSCAPVPATTCG